MHYFTLERCILQAYLRVDQAANKVDRVISLPYSMDALRYLTDGYCHPDYLETLRTKMEVYQAYKVEPSNRIIM